MWREKWPTLLLRQAQYWKGGHELHSAERCAVPSAAFELATNLSKNCCSTIEISSVTRSILRSRSLTTRSVAASFIRSSSASFKLSRVQPARLMVMHPVMSRAALPVNAIKLTRLPRPRNFGTRALSMMDIPQPAELAWKTLLPSTARLPRSFCS